MPKKNTRDFTVIDLLVVVAIIAGFVAILMPVLNMREVNPLVCGIQSKV